MWRRVLLIIILTAGFCSTVNTQKVAISNNLLMDGMGSANFGVEFRTGVRTTMNIPASLNLWSFSDNNKFKHFAVQPEYRWWVCQPFVGHFWGVHAHYALYNVGGIGPFKAIKDNRYEGWLVGAGVSYGYSWLLAPRWSLEATVGVGYAYMDYDRFKCGKCGQFEKHASKHYFGPSKLGLTLVFLIK